MIAAAALPIRAEEPVNRTIKMPARESYRKPYDVWVSGREKSSEFQRHIKITVSPATFPYPLLKYRLNTYSTELESGNAAPLYSQALAEYQRIYAEAERNWYASNEYFALKKSGVSEDRIEGELFARSRSPAWPYGSFPKKVSRKRKRSSINRWSRSINCWKKPAGCASPTGTIAWNTKGLRLPWIA